jgi:uncharacterized protein (DUF1800 family)
MAADVSERERISHVIRRLSMGTHPEVLAGLKDPSAAVDRALDLSSPGAPLLSLPPPMDFQAGTRRADILEPVLWWIERMGSPDRLIEERLVWFWHDHFATSIAKVPSPYLMWQQHLTIRDHATGSFADLLKAMSRDPAMLVYLDGIISSGTEPNENFGRECLELFTMGRDSGYTQDDVVAASRAFTGWVVNLPGRAAVNIGTPWHSVFVRQRFDAGQKTLLGTSGPLDMDGALAVILDQPATARFVATKLYRELVGLTPSDTTVTRLAKRFRKDYAILPLVEAIARSDDFVSDAAVRAKYRSPVEKLVAIMQAAGTTTLRRQKAAALNAPLIAALRGMSSMPFLPPNVGGFPKGARLSGPGNLVHTFDLLDALDVAPPAPKSTDELFARFGVYDVSDDTRTVLTRRHDAPTRFALALTSPEVTLT